MSTEIFNTATWNFLMGNRDVENIIRNNPGCNLVVRGGLATVLPTINCLRDLKYQGWRDFPEVPIISPANTITSFSPDINEYIKDGELFSLLLEKSYGIRLIDRPVSFSETLIVLVDDIGNDRDIFTNVRELLLNGNKNQMIAALPENVLPSPCMRELLKMTPFATIYEGNNVFFSRQVEEAVVQREPGHILMVGKNPARLFYSAIGAVDYFINVDAIYRNPGDLKIWNLMEMGRRVTVLKSPPNNGGNGKATILEAVKNHLENDLNVQSTSDDFRFTPVPDHKIAIDMMS